MERKMKNQSENVWGGSQLSYEAPRVEVLEVSVERGFATSGDNSRPAGYGSEIGWGDDDE
jgi:hypothetical protein